MKRSGKPQHSHVVLPGAQEWQLWRWTGTEAHCVASADSVSALRASSDATICLPSSETACFAIWLTTTEQSMVPEMARLQAEARFPREVDEDVRAAKAVGSEEARILALVVIAPPDPPSLQGIFLAARFAPAFSAYPFPADSLTVLRELDCLLAVATREGEPVGLSRLGASRLDASAATELICFAMRLSAEGLSPELTSVAIWAEPFDDPFSSQLERAGLSCQSRERPAPRIPGPELDLSPERFVMARKREHLMKKVRRGLIAAVGAFSLALAAWFVRYGWLEFQYHRLIAANAALSPEASKLREAANRWYALEPSINPRLFGLERLNQFASRLPDQGVRLTLFRMDAKGILLSGEADRPAQVVEYQGALAAAPELAALKLTMPPPKIMQDNIARFEVLGATKGTANATKVP